MLVTEDVGTPYYANAHIHKSYLLQPPEPEPEPELNTRRRSGTPPRRFRPAVQAVVAANALGRAPPPLPTAGAAVEMRAFARSQAEQYGAATKKSASMRPQRAEP